MRGERSMSNIEKYPKCHMRTSLGNCDPIGGFCTSIKTDICEALHKVAEPKTGWIPVSEKPKENGKYIASLEDSVYPEASFFNGKWFMRSLNGIAREFGEYEVIAWMPLPPVYQGE